MTRPRNKPKRLRVTERAAPRRVSFATNPWDADVWLYVREGRSTRYIARKTGLTLSQAALRAQRTGLKRIEYRDGLIPGTNQESPFCKMLERAMDEAARSYVANEIARETKAMVNYRVRAGQQVGHRKLYRDGRTAAAQAIINRPPAALRAEIRGQAQAVDRQRGQAPQPQAQAKRGNGDAQGGQD